MPTAGAFGARVKRVEDPRFLLGKAQYLSDMQLPGQLSVAFVRTLSGFRPALASCAESAIEKHAAWAAATSSSGFVPVTPSSKRVENE